MVSLSKTFMLAMTLFVAFSCAPARQDLAAVQRAGTALNTEGTIFYSPTSDEVMEYYSSIKEGDSGSSLLSKLQVVLKNGQKKLVYETATAKSSDTYWLGYMLCDRDFDLSPLTSSELSGSYKSSGVWINALYQESPIYVSNRINNGDFQYYSDWNPKTHSGTTLVSGTFSSGTAQLDREHVLPKSFGFNGSNNAYKNMTAGCDLHNLHPGESNGNQKGHNNYPYGTVRSRSSSTTIKSGITGEDVGWLGTGTRGNTVFEPIDSEKGDIARSIFYMAARYHDYEVDPNNSNTHTPALALGNAVDKIPTIEPEATSSSPAIYGELDDLLEWNISDPVDEYEIRRNDLVHLGIQGNRNPFIDFPSWANACFGNDDVDFSDIKIRKLYLGEIVEEEEDTLIEYSSYKLAESINDLKIGSNVIIAASDYDVAMSTVQNSNNRGVTSVTKGDDGSLAIDSRVQEFILVNGTMDGTYSFMTNEGKYLYADSSSSNYLRTSTEKNNDASFAISISNNVATCIAQGDCTRNDLRYNKSNGIFSCYGNNTTQLPVSLYVKEPDSFTTINPDANLSFKFNRCIDDNGDRILSNFNNVSLNVKLSYQLSKRTNPYQEAGLIIDRTNNKTNYANPTTSLLSGDGITSLKWKNPAKDSYIVGISEIPSSDYSTSFLAVGYIKIDDVYYFTEARELSVVILLQKYSTMNNTIKLTDENGETDSYLISDIANSFLEEIEQ